MNIITSNLFGLNGKYNFCGIDINFGSRRYGLNVFGNNFFSKTTEYLLGNPVVKIATLGYLHVFIHEMGHALAAKLYGDPSPSIHIYTNFCQGETKSSLPSNLFISLAGPMLSILWELAKLTAAIGLAILLPPPVGLPLGVFLGAGSAFWLFGEVVYACSRNGDWDFLR